MTSAALVDPGLAPQIRFNILFVGESGCGKVKLCSYFLFHRVTYSRLHFVYLYLINMVRNNLTFLQLINLPCQHPLSQLKKLVNFI
jgi:hypothetical protein